jgi:hypothetical protein
MSFVSRENAHYQAFVRNDNRSEGNKSLSVILKQGFLFALEASSTGGGLQNGKEE